MHQIYIHHLLRNTYQLQHVFHLMILLGLIYHYLVLLLIKITLSFLFVLIEPVVNHSHPTDLLSLTFFSANELCSPTYTLNSHSPKPCPLSGSLLKVTWSNLETTDSILSPHLNYFVSIIKDTHHFVT